ncbi:hypothetical protein MASR2M15_01890 [Anaerolineales bacterium]
MNIFGVGGTEFVLIFIIMLVIAGPQRMIQWAYILGKYLAVLRQLWAQSMDSIEKELHEAGYDITLPKTPPTRNEINKMVQKAVEPIQKPLEESYNRVMVDADNEMQNLKHSLDPKQPESSSKVNSLTEQNPPTKPKLTDNSQSDALGLWSHIRTSDDD